jgi:hypothetical protein
MVRFSFQFSRKKENMERLIVSDYEVIRHGIDYPDYFQGCGVSWTRFDHVTTGIGQTEIGALDDALESMAQCSAWEDNELNRIEKEILKNNPDMNCHDIAGFENDCGESPWWHVSIRFSLGKVLA